MTSFLLIPDDSLYPPLLKEISDPPERLWGEGAQKALSAPLALAIVGAREATPYGQKIAFDLGRDLARAGVTVISGLAYGIDTAAHRGALEGGREGRGTTVAVLGCGLDIPYPADNLDLKKEISQKGAVISEFEAGTRGTSWTFPRRNRIISGLSRGVIVVEAAVKSGALITAELALQQGRDVFAVPGNLGSSMSEGTNRLIQQGAKLVLSVQDILEEFSWGMPQLEIPLRPPLKKGDTGGFSDTPEGKILSLLSQTPRHVDELIATTQIPASSLSEILVQLEIGGKITALPGSCFIRNEG